MRTYRMQHGYFLAVTAPLMILRTAASNLLQEDANEL